MNTSLRQLWNDMIACYSIDNEKLGLVLFHVLMGQVFKTCIVKFGNDYKDLRISCLAIQPTRTGKGQAMKVMKKVANELQMKVVKESDVTSAGLIGTIDTNIVRANIVKNLQPGDPRYQNPVIYGDLYHADLIIYDEAKSLIIPNRWSMNIHDVLQEALDTPGEVRKKLAANYPIEFTSTASIAATTYFLDDIGTVMLGQGFFQRILIHYKDLDINTRTEMRKKVLDSYAEETSTDFNLLMQEFCAYVKTLPTDKTITIGKDAKQLINETIMKYEEYIANNYHGEEYTSLMSFVQGLQEQFIKVAAHYALIDKEVIIQPTHVQSAKLVINNCMESLAKGLVAKISSTRNKNQQSTQLKILGIVSTQPSWNKEALYQELRDRMNLGRNKAIIIVTDLINQNMLIEQKGEKNTKQISLRTMK